MCEETNRPSAGSSATAASASACRPPKTPCEASGSGEWRRGAAAPRRRTPARAHSAAAHARSRRTGPPHARAALYSLPHTSEQIRAEQMPQVKTRGDIPERDGVRRAQVQRPGQQGHELRGELQRGGGAVRGVAARLAARVRLLVLRHCSRRLPFIS